MTETATTTGPRRLLLPGTAKRLVAFVAAATGLGALAGIVWFRVTPLATYTVSETGRAGTSERALTLFFAGDAWFCVIGAVVGLAIGVSAWLRFRTVGWPVVLVALVGGVLAALACWEVGTQLGPDDFLHRIAAARPGDTVPIDLTLRAPVSLVVWPFLAVVPVLLGSSLGRDEEDPRSARRPVRPRADAGDRSPDSPGESR